jgi:hypothetical protein
MPAVNPARVDRVIFPPDADWLRDQIAALRIEMAKWKRDHERLEKLMLHYNLNRSDVDKMIAPEVEE